MTNGVLGETADRRGDDTNIGSSSIALSNLRAVVIVIVLAFHSALAYLASAPADGPGFDRPPYTWQAFPIVDSHRWIGFDIFCAWQDLSLMALMFLLSGLLAAGSLQRRGVRAYVISRLARIGVPFTLAVLFLSPASFYPAYLTRTLNPDAAGFFSQWLALPFWPSGPQWFLWQVLVANLMAAAVYAIWPRVVDVVGRAAAAAAAHPRRWFAIFALASAVAYVPLALSFSPWTWNAIGPFSLQLCRPALYLVYFIFGFALGSHGLKRGLLATGGALARHATVLLAAATACFMVWAGLTSLTLPDWSRAPLLAQIGAGLAFPLAGATGSLSLIAVCLRHLAGTRSPLLDALSQNAYGIYLVHYVFVVWLQYLLLERTLFVAVKFATVFTGAIVLSLGVNLAGNRFLAKRQIDALRKTALPAPPLS